MISSVHGEKSEKNARPIIFNRRNNDFDHVLVSRNTRGAKEALIEHIEADFAHRLLDVGINAAGNVVVVPMDDVRHFVLLGNFNHFTTNIRPL